MSQKDLTIYLEDGTFMTVKANKTDTTDVIVDLVFMKMAKRPDGVSSEYTLAEVKNKEVTRLLVDEEWPYSSVKVKGSKGDKPKFDLILVRKDCDVLQVNERLAVGLMNDAVSVMETGSMRGFLMKRGHQNKNWKKRWCIINDGVLSYYDDEPNDPFSNEGKSVKGDTSLVGAYVTPCNSLGKQYCFLISNTKGGKDFYFYAETAADFDAWITAIRRHSMAYRELDTGALSSTVDSLSEQLESASAELLARGGGASSSSSNRGSKGMSASQVQVYESTLAEMEHRSMVAEAALAEALKKVAELEAEVARLKGLVTTSTGST